MSEKYVVKKGDNLSKIGQERWREIYRENRSKIGEDPNVIKPGQKLALPNGIAPQPVDEYVDPPSYAPDSCMSCTCDSLASSTYETWDVYYSELPVTPAPKTQANKGTVLLFAKTSIETLFELAERRTYNKGLARWDYDKEAKAATGSLRSRAAAGKLSIEELEEAAEHRNPDVRRIAAKDPRTPTEVLFELAENYKGAEHVYCAIVALEQLNDRAKAGNLTTDDIEEAADHCNPRVRMIAATNSKASNEILFELAEKRTYNKRLARWDYDKEAKAAVGSLWSRTRAGKLSIEELEEAAEHRNPDVRRIAAKDPRTPTEVLFELAENYKGAEHAYCAMIALEQLNNRAKAGNLTTDDIEEAADHRNPDIRMIAANSH